jgi:DNA phosphorothioation-dependent restriction protein DptG
MRQTNVQQFGAMGIVFDDQNMRHVIPPYPCHEKMSQASASGRALAAHEWR